MTTYPISSRAAVLEHFGAPVPVSEVRVPQLEELEPRAILVRVRMASVCGTDVHLWEGGAFNANPMNLPQVMGHEMVGEIVAFGEGPHVDSLGQPLKVGDRILWSHAPCGTCYYCSVIREPSLCLNRQSYGRLPTSQFPYISGGFAEFCYVFPNSGRVKVPDEVPDSWASAASCALRTVVHLLETIDDIAPHETAVVQGVGPLGLYAVSMLKHRGVGTIIAIGAPDARLALAKSYGATHLVSVEELPSADARVDVVRAATTGGRGADVVLEMSGARSAVVEGLAFIAPGGRYGIVGQTNPTAVEIDPSIFVRKQISVHGALSAHIGHYAKALDFLRQTKGEYDWDAMFTSPVGLDRVTDAMAGMRRGVMKPLIDPSL
ncbi:alcohol dehydrogenase [Cryobacterium glaciale]|uniref:Alcohol dehydrogenase n=1 Tax=Cryobacterium glaciale TaxID=1259145 RepID=A0A4V3I818_9MICO|nr:zinc-binding dehydrogenase [Cryobacterium glaciale]TFB72117.1 alcohol dehydrogenase [Cryobacterium glaciale]